jgi:hypothetical protein
MSLYRLWAGSPGAEGESSMADSASYGNPGKKSVCISNVPPMCEQNAAVSESALLSDDTESLD